MMLSNTSTGDQVARTELWEVTLQLGVANPHAMERLFHFETKI